MLIAEQLGIDVFGSNLGQNTAILGYPPAITRFLTVPPGIFRYRTLFMPLLPPSMSFPLHQSLGTVSSVK
jgi:hypothetical protein